MPASPIADLAQPFAVVAHDAGAANLIVAWLDPSNPPKAVMQGPAERSWRARMGNAPLCETIEEALDGVEWLLTGTGWASDLEHDARLVAAIRGIRSVAVIDHWVNYHSRFERAGCRQLPDEIWVTDQEALRIAQSTFDRPIRQQPNSYLTEEVARIDPPHDPWAALYVLEPARDDWGRGVPGEFQALDWFMSHRSRLGMTLDDPVRLRPHPSDPDGKYDDWLQRNPRAVLDDSSTLNAAIARAGIVVGAETHAMVVALAAGRRVICALPPWAPPCRLPHSDIERLG